MNDIQAKENAYAAAVAAEEKVAAEEVDLSKDLKSKHEEYRRAIVNAVTAREKNIRSGNAFHGFLLFLVFAVLGVAIVYGVPLLLSYVAPDFVLDTRILIIGAAVICLVLFIICIKRNHDNEKGRSLVAKSKILDNQLFR